MMIPSSKRLPESHFRNVMLVVILVALFIPLSSAAQEEPVEDDPPSFGYVGLFGGITLNSHAVRLDPSRLTGVASVPIDPLFTEGSGRGWTGGLLLEFPLSGLFGVGGRLAMQERGAEMTAQYENRIDVITSGGTVRPATVEVTVPSRLTYFAATPHIRVTPESLPLYLFAGPSLLFPLTTTYSYKEEIISERGLIFPGVNGPRRTRILDGAIPEAVVKLGATVGIGVEINLTDKHALLLDAQYAPMIGDLSTGIGSERDWRADIISFTLGIKTGFVRRKAEPLPPPPPPDIIVIEVDTVEIIEAKVVTDEGLLDTLVARSQKVQQTEVHALLPYIFFDHDSATIPDRYAQIERRNVRNWREERIERGSTMNVYYELLNIVGYRLRVNRRAEIKITGCVGEFETEDSTLALRRAEAVRDYLRDVWRIRENRMTIVTRELPQNPSLSEVDTLEGDVENRRVEIYSETLSLLKPVKLPDTLLLEPAGVIRLLRPPSGSTDSLAQLESWQVNVTVGDSLIERAAAGFGPPPEKIDLELKSRPDLNRRGPIEITSELIILDSLYVRKFALPSTPVWFVEEGGFEVERNVENDMYVDRYNLLLHSFDSAGIFDFTQQASTILRERITPESQVKITGHTDRIGLPYYNKRLATRRAELAAQITDLENAQIVGVGERDSLYDNDTPEGRYYSRTVAVEIKTPIVRKDISDKEAEEESVEQVKAEVERETQEASATEPVTSESNESEIKESEPTVEQPAEVPTRTTKKEGAEGIPTSVTLPDEDE